jgi:hypothetical protein
MSEASGRLAPAGSDFYAGPAAWPDGDHGDVIWWRPLAGPAALSAAATNELVLYRSVSAGDEPVAVSGIVALPPGPVPDKGWPVVSWAHGTLGSADVCAPSRDTATASAHIFNQAPHVLLDSLVGMGWAVVMTDYEGLGTPGAHPYLLGVSEARGILDIVRAARSLHPELSSMLAVVGHSQGGQAALFAAHHRAWTPEADMRGVAAIAPASAVRTLLLNGAGYPRPDPGVAFTPLFLTGAVAGDPSIDAAQVLSDEAYALWPDAEVRCRVDLSRPDSWGGIAGTSQLRQPANAHTAAFLAQLDAMHPDLDIDVPIRVVQAVDDPRIRAVFTTPLGEQLRKRNGADNVTYDLYRSVSATKYPEQLGYHFGTIDTDVPMMTKWLAEQFSRAAA